MRTTFPYRSDSANSRLNVDLLPSEWAFLSAIHRLWFGRFEFLRILNGELVLEPWPASVRVMKFGSDAGYERRSAPDDIALKSQVIELFEYIRSVQEGDIRVLEVRHGIPFLLEIVSSGDSDSGTVGGHRA